MQNPFRYFSTNKRGRDFVVGDLHGHFSDLELMLVELGFNPKKDRLFSVGDLIDRGPESFRCIEFLNYPWFHPIMGNHEKMLLESASDKAMCRNWINNNGGDWWRNIPENFHPRFRKIIAALPYAMEVNTRHGKVGIVHADIPLGQSWPHFIKQLALNHNTRRHALWSRSRYKTLSTTGHAHPIDDIDLVVFGHTPITKPIQQANFFYIDTGAPYTHHEGLGRLTMLEIHPNIKMHQIRTGAKDRSDTHWRNVRQKWSQAKRQ